jgi:hypothetical protein
MTDSTAVICPTCGRDDFADERGMKCHHSRMHGESIAGVETECDHCGRTFREQPARLEKLEHHFCDEECEGKWRSEYQSGEDHPHWNRRRVECEYCGKALERTVSELEDTENSFCDASCRGRWRSEEWTQEDFPRWNGGKETVRCHACGESFKRESSELNRYERSFCSRECFGEWRSEYQRGSDNPSWTGGSGVRSSVRNTIGAQPWGKIAEEYRGECCELCGTDETVDGREFPVHHLVPIMSGGTNDPELLMTLCTSCHRTVEAYTRRFTRAVLVDD